MKDINSEKLNQIILEWAEAGAEAKAEAKKVAALQKFRAEYKYIYQQKMKQKAAEVFEQVMQEVNQDVVECFDILGKETIEIEQRTAQPISEISVAKPKFGSFQEHCAKLKQNQSSLIALNDPNRIAAASESVLKSVPIDLDEISEA